MLVGKDTSLTLRFPVGKKYVIATILFKKGEESEEILRIFFVRENIPVYLENSIFQTVHSFLQDDSFFQEEIDSIVNCEVMERNLKEYGEYFAKSTKNWYRDSPNSLLKLSNLRSNSVVKFDEKATKFTQEFHSLVNQSTQTCEMIIRATDFLQLAYQKLTSLRKVELDDMYSNQSDEMNKAMGLDQSNISNLVVKHVKELEELELKYKEKFEAARKVQRIKFREYITKLYSGEKIEYNVFDPPEDDDSRNEKRWNRRWFKLRDEPLENQQIQDVKFDDEKLGFECNITVSIGSKSPIIYVINLTTTPVPTLIRKSIRDKRLLVKSTKSLYGRGLSSYVIISEPNLSYFSKSITDILEISEQSTDLHFHSLTHQLNEYKAQLNNNDMEMGDFYITKHSNIGDAQILFHLFGIDTKKSTITENSLQCSSESPLFIGLKNILEIALQYDVSTISIPLLLIDALPEHLFNHTACLGRSITIMRAIKNLLLDSTDDTLRTIRFILPPVSSDVFEKYKAALKNIFSYQI